MNKTSIYIMTSVVLIILFVLIAINPTEKPPSQVYQVSFIYRGDVSEDNQRIIRQGLEQAANDFNVELTSIATGNIATADEQVKLIQKEVEEGTDAILIEPIDEELVEKKIREVQEKIPIIELNSETTGKSKKNISKIQSKGYDLGTDLAKKIVKHVQLHETVVLLKSGLKYSDINNKYQGVYDYLVQKNIPIQEIQLGNNEKSNETTIINLMCNQETRHLVAFDSVVLELLGKVKKEGINQKYIQIYGMGKTNQIISYVEEDVIQVIGVDNEYSIGYLGIQKAVAYIEGTTSGNKEIEYAIIDRHNIYTTKNQRLLFPFVQ
ncbi:substrate-binding domain-containing protein [Lachnospiraceae bacterium LCP25S3_G4]